MKLLGIKIGQEYPGETLTFARLLQQRGDQYEADVLYQHRAGEGTQAKEAFEETAEVSVLPVDTGWRASSGMSLFAEMRLRASLPALARLTREIKPDLIYSGQNLWEVRTAAYLALNCSCLHIAHLQQGLNDAAGKAIVPFLKKVDHVVAASDYIRQQAVQAGVAVQRTSVLPPIALPLSFHPATQAGIRHDLRLPAEAVVTGVPVGTGEGLQETLEAFASVAAELPMAHLLLIGDGEKAYSMYQLAETKGLKNRVHLTGCRRDVERLMSALDIFCNPARQDAAGREALDASAKGLPVVAYGTGGIPEIVVDGETGFLVPPGEILELASSLQRLIADTTLRTRMGQAGQQRVRQQFHPSTVGAQFGRLLQTLHSDEREAEMDHRTSERQVA